MSYALVIFCLVSGPAMDPAEKQRYEQGLALYDAGRHAEAAAHFEEMAVHGAPKRRFEAGQMRFAAGHLAHAWRHFHRYLESDIDAEQREIGEARLASAAEGTRVIEARLLPADVAATVVAHRIGDPPGMQRPDLPTPVDGGIAALRLDPGAWELRVEVPGYQPLRRVIDVRDTTPPVELRLVPVPAVVPPPAVAPAETAAGRGQLRRGRGQVVAGAVMVPLGLAALGGLVATLVVHESTRSAFKNLGVDGYGCNDLEALGDLRSRARREAGAMVGLGVASAGFLTAGVLLLVRGQQLQQRARLSLDVRPDRAGLLLSGHF